ncbi:MAG: hypothetical protein MZW92_23100 [Comamonadaceae bacterium]|nr:hypothetical protein [Comamonadaceae bacterium]
MLTAAAARSPQAWRRALFRRPRPRCRSAPSAVLIENVRIFDGKRAAACRRHRTCWWSAT